MSITASNLARDHKFRSIRSKSERIHLKQFYYSLKRIKTIILFGAHTELCKQIHDRFKDKHITTMKRVIKNMSLINLEEL